MSNREIKKLIGKIWGKQYGKISSQEMAILKKTQKEYDESAFHVSAGKVAYKISKQREQTILQEFGNKGIRQEWDPQILVFAKDMAVDPNFTSDVLLYLARDCLLDEMKDPIANEDRLVILERIDKQGKNESLTLKQRHAERCYPPIEFIVFFKMLLELWQDDINEVLHIIFFNPIEADNLLRKAYVDREPFIDAVGERHKQPDQPIIGRYTPHDEIRELIGSSNELFTARLILIFMYAAYYPLYRQDWIGQEAKKWIEQKFDINYWFDKINLENIEKEIELAKQLMIIKVYWDGLITQLRKTFYQKKDFKGLANETVRLIDEIKNHPKTNVVFSQDLLKQKILHNINSGIFYHYEQNLKLKTEAMKKLFEDQKEEYLKEFEAKWESGDWFALYKYLWHFWNDLKSKSAERRREELVISWEYAKEQRRYIESFDTIQKKHFSKISSIMQEKPPETGIQDLDRAIALITLEISEIALSGINVGHFHRKKFEESLLQQLTEQIKFLLPFRDKFDQLNGDSDDDVKKPAFDAELEKAIGKTIFNYLNDWFSIIKDVFKARDRFLREKLTITEKYEVVLQLYERYVRSGIEMLKYFNTTEQIHVLEQLQRLNILEFAKYVVLASNTKLTLREAYEKAGKYFDGDPVKLDGQSKYLDVVLLLRMVEDNLVEDVAKSETSSELRQTFQLVDSNLDYQKRVQLKDCEKIIRSYLEKQNIRNIQQYIQAFRKQVYEWDIVRYVDKDRFIEWLSKLDTSKSHYGSFLPKEKKSEILYEIAIVYLDVTGERKGIGRESNKALDSGLFQAIRPGEIIRNFGLQLRNMEFTVHDPKFPVQWVWLNHLSVVGKDSQKAKVLESSLFINMDREPNIRNLDAVHSLIHRILEGKERRDIVDDNLIDSIIRGMISDVLIEEQSEAIKFFENQPKFGLVFNLEASTYVPYLLLIFNLTKTNYKLSWDTIEMYANPELRPTREEFSTSGYPWVIDTSNRFRDVLIDMFNKRLDGSVNLSKAAFLWPENNKLYFTIADVNPETNTAKIVIFRNLSENDPKPEQTYQFVDIRRRLDLILSYPPQKFGFKNIIERMNASDIQLVIDKLENY